MHIGQVVSHYRIVSRIGSGGMGEVFRAEDQRLRRTVALKFLPPESVKDDTARERFMREARAASALDHPNICTIHDIDEDETGRLFITMACYDGETLRSSIDHGPLPIADAIGIARQLAEGLAKAHDGGITHRDLNPSNILITRDRVVKIVDFGLATLTGAARITSPFAAAGTLAYMAPEQLRGEEADARADIWAFGVVLFEMLAGVLPFSAEHPAALMYAIANEEPADLSAVRREVPGSIVQLCRQCLRKNPGERPQTMHDVLGMLGQWPFEISSVAPSAMQRMRTRYFVPLLVTVLVLLVCAGYLIFRPSGGGEQTPVRMKLGILPFTMAYADSSLADWSFLAQRLLAADLTGYENAGVVDPLSLNSMLGDAVLTRQLSEGKKILQAAAASGIGLLVDGTVFRGENGLVLRATLIRTETGEAAFSCEAVCSTDRSLPQATGQLARQVIDFVDVQLLHARSDPDMRTWMQHHTDNFAAIKAFMRAAETSFVGGTGAEQDLRAALLLDSTFLAPRIWLIPGLVRSHRIAEAEYQVERLKAMTSSASPFERAMITWADAFVRNDLVTQDHALTTALTYSPQNNILLFNLARTKYLLEDFAGATNALEAPVESGWAYAPAHYLLGACENARGNTSEARRVLERSLTLKNVYPDTYALLASLAVRAGDSTAADRYEVSFLQSARTAGVPQAEASATIGGIYLADGFGQRALRHYDVAVSQSPSNAQYHEERGEAFEQCGDSTLAEQCFVRALNCDSLQPAAHLHLGRIYDRRARAAEALAQYNLYLRYDSTSTDAREVRARTATLQQLTSSHRP